MAALVAVRKFRDGAGLIHAIYMQGNVVASDTMQVSADFSKISAVYAWNLSANVAVTMTNVGTNLTVGAGPLNDDLVIFVVGGAA